LETLIESIAVKNGQICHLEWHENRYQASFLDCFGKAAENTLLQGLELNLPTQGDYKLRITYAPRHKNASLSPYQVKPINSLKLVCNDSIDYHLKSSQRSEIDQLFAQRQNCDDILIIKNHLVSDTSTGNILFFDGQGWYTPSSPLLEGTHRARLLSQGHIKERLISQQDLRNYIGFQVINALRPFHPDFFTDISHIMA